MWHEEHMKIRNFKFCFNQVSLINQITQGIFTKRLQLNNLNQYIKHWDSYSRERKSFRIYIEYRGLNISLSFSLYFTYWESFKLFISCSEFSLLFLHIFINCCIWNFTISSFNDMPSIEQYSCQFLLIARSFVNSIWEFYFEVSYH